MNSVVLNESGNRWMVRMILEMQGIRAALDQLRPTFVIRSCDQNEQHRTQTVWKPIRKSITVVFQLTPNQLLYQQKRFRGKINLKKPKIYYKKAILNQLLMPFFPNPRENTTIEELCARAQAPKIFELGPYEKIIAKEIRNWFDSSKMVACVHVNSISMLDTFDVRVPLERANMYYKRYSCKLVRAALEGSDYVDKFEPLISKHNAYIFSPNVNVTALEKVMRRCPQMFTIGGMLDGVVLRLADFLKYGKMDITSAQFDLVQTLQNAGGVHLNRQLAHHPTTLVSRLKQIGTNGLDTNEDKESVPV